MLQTFTGWYGVEKNRVGGLLKCLKWFCRHFQGKREKSIFAHKNECSEFLCNFSRGSQPCGHSHFLCNFSRVFGVQKKSKSRFFQNAPNDLWVLWGVKEPGLRSS